MTICLEISGTELKFTVAGRSKQLRELSRPQGLALAAVAIKTAVRPSIGAVGTPDFISDAGRPLPIQHVN